MKMVEGLVNKRENNTLSSIENYEEQFKDLKKKLEEHELQNVDNFTLTGLILLLTIGILSIAIAKFSEAKEDKNNK
jgi:hypothetical protein